MPRYAEMVGLLGRLLGIVEFAIISGGAWAQFEEQVLAFLPHHQRLQSLSLLPPRGANHRERNAVMSGKPY